MRAALITGAYGGMGRAVAQRLVREGYTVFALDIRTGEAEAGIVPIPADLRDSESVKRAACAVREHTDRLDVILHFAGMYNLDSLVELPDEEFCRIFDINFRGAYLVNKHFLPFLQYGSRILITTSELAPLDPLPFTGIYAVTKAALDKYAYSLAMELQLLGIGVSVLRAGAVDTGMLGASTAALDRFCEGTRLYSCNADRFKKIVDTVEARCVKPEKIAEKCVKIMKKKHPRFAYSINRNPLLLFFNLLPKRAQLFAIRTVLRQPKKDKENKNEKA